MPSSGYTNTSSSKDAIALATSTKGCGSPSPLPWARPSKTAPLACPGEFERGGLGRTCTLPGPSAAASDSVTGSSNADPFLKAPPFPVPPAAPAPWRPLPSAPAAPGASEEAASSVARWRKKCDGRKTWASTLAGSSRLITPATNRPTLCDRRNDDTKPTRTAAAAAAACCSPKAAELGAPVDASAAAAGACPTPVWLLGRRRCGATQASPGSAAKWRPESRRRNPASLAAVGPAPKAAPGAAPKAAPGAAPRPW
mmetsp:Transcript_67125/g.151791  ORF Transcript_67125/g.151791 Transcript_67125/m.151791 type:complete len:255 (+) Transcript_67125:671-1435(+)